MNATDEIKKISCYAVLQNGYAGENYLVPHMRLVLYLVYRKGYRKIVTHALIADFLEEYKYCIDYFPMRQILGLAVEYGYLRKSHNTKAYTPTEKIEEFREVVADISNSETRLHRFILEFQQFSQKCDANYSNSNAGDIVIAYVNSQKLEHISGHITGVADDARVDYVFGKFVYWIRENNKDLFDFLNVLVTGSILADCLTFHEVLTNNRQLDGMTVILDSSIVFMTLGLDVIDRSVYYKALISSLRAKGAQVALFAHSYNEMMGVIIGAASWVESYAYDPALASITTDYFRSINATRSEVEEYSYTLKSRINAEQIDILNVDYLPTNYAYQQDEAQLYSMIVEHYRRTNPLFDESAQKSSIELDARSITHVYLLRKAQLPHLISDASHLFITANRTLSKIAYEYNKIVFGHPDTIPASLTDVFLGTFIWLSDPVKTMQMNEQQITAHAYLAFQPNAELVQKLSNTVKGLLARGKIDADTCYTLMSSKLVMDKLAKRTLGDPNAYTEDTPMDILAEIKNEGRQEGFEEATKLQKTAQNELIQQREIIRKEHAEEKTQLINQIASVLNISIKRKTSHRDDLLLRKKRAEKYLNKVKKSLLIATIATAVVMIGAVIWIWVDDNLNQKEILSLITVIVPFALWIMAFIINAFYGKTIRPREVLNRLIERRYDRKCLKLNFNDAELTLLSDEIAQDKAQLNELFNNQVEST